MSKNNSQINKNMSEPISSLINPAKKPSIFRARACKKGCLACDKKNNKLEHIVVYLPAKYPSCPPGLEKLIPVDHLFVRQGIRETEPPYTMISRNKFEVLDGTGRRIFVAKDSTDNILKLCCRGGCGQPFRMSIKEKSSGYEILAVNSRPDCYGAMSASISQNGMNLGFLHEDVRCCSSNYIVIDAQGNEIFRIYDISLGSPYSKKEAGKRNSAIKLAESSSLAKIAERAKNMEVESKIGQQPRNETTGSGTPPQERDQEEERRHYSHREKKGGRSSKKIETDRNDDDDNVYDHDHPIDEAETTTMTPRKTGTITTTTTAQIPGPSRTGNEPKPKSDDNLDPRIRSECSATCSKNLLTRHDDNPNNYERSREGEGVRRRTNNDTSALQNCSPVFPRRRRVEMGEWNHDTGDVNNIDGGGGECVEMRNFSAGQQRDDEISIRDADVQPSTCICGWCCRLFARRRAATNEGAGRDDRSSSIGVCRTLDSCIAYISGGAEFAVYSCQLGVTVGKMGKQWDDLFDHHFHLTECFGVNFPRDLSVRHKALLLGALLVLDFNHFQL
ncbi:uncharacterized protein LOC118433592 [Folsomia candida]|uniref:uncharacterized protein LOC118433592 n=1 Tax=Folsomia candida TaxID=158441 RepID=UPI001604E67D|nr:uncharacterized protein LOC118433592 [Folsomia candida]